MQKKSPPKYLLTDIRWLVVGRSCQQWCRPLPVSRHSWRSSMTCLKSRLTWKRLSGRSCTVRRHCWSASVAPSSCWRTLSHRYVASACRLSFELVRASAPGIKRKSSKRLGPPLIYWIMSTFLYLCLSIAHFQLSRFVLHLYCMLGKQWGILDMFSFIVKLLYWF